MVTVLVHIVAVIARSCLTQELGEQVYSRLDVRFGAHFVHRMYVARRDGDGAGDHALVRALECPCIRAAARQNLKLVGNALLFSNILQVAHKLAVGQL